MLANYAFSFPVYIHQKAHISFMRIFPSAVEKSPTVFSENRRKKWGILRIFSETPPEGICHGVILRNLIHSFVYFLFLSLSAPFPVISPGHPAISISFAPLYRIDYCCEATLKSPAINTGVSADKKTRPDMAFATPDVFFFHFYTAALCFG